MNYNFSNRILSVLTNVTSNIPNKLSKLINSLSSDNLNNKTNFIKLHSYSFNQDGSCFIASTSCGFRVYKTFPLQEFVRRENCINIKSSQIILAGMLYKTNMFALVLEDDVKLLNLWNDEKQKIIGQIQTTQRITCVKLSKEIIIITTNSLIYIYKNILELICCSETYHNPKGICDLIINNNNDWLVAYPAVTYGSIKIHSYKKSFILNCFNYKINLVCLSKIGHLIACASNTTVKVWSYQLMQLLYKFTVSSSITCLNFRFDACYLLACTRNYEIFKFDLTKHAVNSSSQKFYSILEESMSIGLKKILSSYMSNDEAYFKLPKEKSLDFRIETSEYSQVNGAICSYCPENQDRIFVINYDGVLYIYENNSLKSYNWFSPRAEFKIEDNQVDESWNVIS